MSTKHFKVDIEYEVKGGQQVRSEDDALLKSIESHFDKVNAKISHLDQSMKKFGKSQVDLLGGISTAAAGAADKTAKHFEGAHNKIVTSAKSTHKKVTESVNEEAKKQVAAHESAMKLLDASRKRYADLQKKYESDAGKQIIRDLKNVQDEKVRILSAIGATTDKQIKAELRAYKQSYDEQARMLRQLALEKQKVVEGGIGGSVGLLGVGRRTLGDYFFPGAGVGEAAKRGFGKLEMFGAESSKSLLSATSLSRYVGKGGLAAAVLYGGKEMVEIGADFETELNKAFAIAGDLTEQQKERMKKAALETSVALNLDAKDAAAGFYGLISAGMNVDQSIKALPAVARFAKAGLMDLATATDLAVGSQNALGLAVDDASQNETNLIRVTDVLTKVNNLSIGNVKEFGEALSNKFGAALRTVNKDVEEGGALLAVFAKQNVRGAEAGEAAAIVMRDFQTKAIANEKAFRANNIAVYDANGQMRDMADIIGDLEKRFEGLTDKQKRQVLAQLDFSDRSVAHTLQLVGMSGAMRDYEKALRSAAGTTQDVSDKQLKTFNERLAHLKDIVDVDLVKAFNKLEPTLAEGLGYAERFIKSTEKDLEMIDKLYQKVKGILSEEEVRAAFNDYGKDTREWTGGHTYRQDSHVQHGVSKVNFGIETPDNGGADGLGTHGTGAGHSKIDAAEVEMDRLRKFNADLQAYNKQQDDLEQRARDESARSAADDARAVTEQLKAIHENRSGELEELALKDVANARKYNRLKIEDEIDTAEQVLKVTEKLGLDTSNAEHEAEKAKRDLRLFDLRNKIEDEQWANKQIQDAVRQHELEQKKIRESALHDSVEPAFRNAWGVASRDFFSKFDQTLHAETNAVGALASGFTKSFAGAIEGKAGKGLADFLFPEKGDDGVKNPGLGGIPLSLEYLRSLGVNEYDDETHPEGPVINGRILALIGRTDALIKRESLPGLGGKSDMEQANKRINKGNQNKAEEARKEARKEHEEELKAEVEYHRTVKRRIKRLTGEEVSALQGKDTAGKFDYLTATGASRSDVDSILKGVSQEQILSALARKSGSTSEHVGLPTLPASLLTAVNPYAAIGTTAAGAFDIQEQRAAIQRNQASLGNFSALYGADTSPLMEKNLGALDKLKEQFQEVVTEGIAEGAAGGLLKLGPAHHTIRGLSKYAAERVGFAEAEGAVAFGADYGAHKQLSAGITYAIGTPEHAGPEEASKAREKEVAAINKTTEAASLAQKGLKSLGLFKADGDTKKAANMAGGIFGAGASIASMFGPAGAPFAAVLGGIGSLFGGFEDGDYTGDGNPKHVAGVAHKGEYYFDHKSTRRVGLDQLRALKYGKASVVPNDLMPIAKQSMASSVTLMPMSGSHAYGTANNHSGEVVGAMNSAADRMEAAVDRINNSIPEQQIFGAMNRVTRARSNTTWRTR